MRREGQAPRVLGPTSNGTIAIVYAAPLDQHNPGCVEERTFVFRAMQLQAIHNSWGC